MNNNRLRKQGIALETISASEKDKLWLHFEKIYVTTKKTEGYFINGIKTEILKDVIDFNEYNKKNNDVRF